MRSISNQLACLGRKGIPVKSIAKAITLRSLSQHGKALSAAEAAEALAGDATCLHSLRSAYFDSWRLCSHSHTSSQPTFKVREQYEGMNPLV